MKKTLSLLLFVVLAWPPLVLGKLSTTAKSMRGLEEVMVSVTVEFEKRPDVFDLTSHRMMVEQRLSELGINVVEELSPDPDIRPFQGNLVLVISPIKFTEDGFIVYYRLALLQLVNLSRDSSPTAGLTWERTLLSANRVELPAFDDRGVKALVDIFADVYFKVNSPEPRSGQGDE